MVIAAPILLPRRTRTLALLGASLLAIATAAAAQGPQGGSVRSGSARISQTATETTIRQSSRRAVIDWRGFDVDQGHAVVFDQPGAKAATLNRVTSASPSMIEGTIRAPGTVIIQNAAGVIFTGTAKVDVGGIVATSQTVRAGRFQRDGSLRIDDTGPGGAVINRGTLTVGEAGLAALVGRHVENAGTIVASKGTVALASGQRTTIDLAGDGLLRIAVEGDVEGGSAVRNSGEIEAGEGRVLLSAGDAASVLDSAINTDGTIGASSRTGTGGTVEILGRGKGKVRVAGSVTASGKAKGGAITATGADLAVAGDLDAHGSVDGGSLRIGGDARGAGPLPRAQGLRIAQGSRLVADGAAGQGGTVVAWSDGDAAIDGAISATGGAGGGSVETSALGQLLVGSHGSVALGEGGSWLIDPRDVVLTSDGLASVPAGTVMPPAGSTPYSISSSAVAAALDAGADVTITTHQPDSAMAGDITVASDLAWSGKGNLRLEAERDIGIDGSIQSKGDGDFTALAARDLTNGGALQSDGTGDLVLQAGRDLHLENAIRASGNGAVSLAARTGDILSADRRTGNIAVTTASGDLTLRATLGSILLRRGGGVFNNLRLASDSGDLTLAAGTRISAQGANGGGSWVRIGSATGSGAVRLSAPEIAIGGGSGGNAFAEVTVGAGGSIALDAARSISVETNAVSGSQGRIAAVNGASLELRAPRQTWNGPVRSGSGSSDGGPVALSGAITAGFVPVFSLMPDATFALAAAGPDGAPSSYKSALALYVQTSDSGTIALDAPVEAGRIELISEESVALGGHARLTGTGKGDAIVVAAGRGFVNGAGADVLQATDPAARWLLYVDRFDGLTGAEPTRAGFDLYGRPFNLTPPAVLAGFAGNRLVYGETPVLTITAGSGSRIYGGPAATLGYRIEGLRPRDSVATALEGLPGVTSDGNRAAASVGLYATNAAATASEQGYALDFVPGALRIDPATLTVTPHGTRRYGASNGEYGLDYSGFVLGENSGVLSGSPRYASSANEASDVGRYGLTVSGLSSGNYRIRFADGIVQVDPAVLRVTANDAARGYGGANPGFSARYDGFVLGQDASALAGALSFATDATAASDVGKYRVTPGGLASRNYTIRYGDGTLTIDPAVLRVTANDAARAYGGANPGFSARYDGFVLGQDAGVLDGALTFATDAKAASDVGRYRVTPGGLASRNYAIQYADGTLRIDPAALTVTPHGSRGYGSEGGDYDLDYSGFVLGQDESVIAGTPHYTSPATGGSDVGTYDLSVSGLTSRNYTITYGGGTLRIDPAVLRVTANDASRTYGGANPGFSARYDGFVLGQDAGDLDGALTLATDAAQASDAGRYRIAASGLSSRNYAITYGDGTLTIDPAVLRVTANDAARTYGGANPAFTARYDGFVLGQDAGDLGGLLALATDATRASDTGRYRIAASGLASRNYAITYEDGALRIDPAALRVTVADANRTYGGANPGFGARYDGFVLGQDASDLGGALTFATDATRASDTGRYRVAASGLTSRNYTITYEDGALRIDPAILTVTPHGSRTYGSDGGRFGLDYDGFVLGQDAGVLTGSPVYATSATRGSDAGSYDLAVSGLAGRNYTVRTAPGTLTIDPAALTVTASSAARTYGADNPALGARFDGFVLGQDASALAGSLKLATTATKASDAGRYKVTASGLASRNYTITYADGTLTIDPAALTITANDATRTYCAADPAFTARYDGLVLGQSATDLTGMLSFATSAGRGSDTGRYRITPSGLSSRNYTITYADGTLTIGKASLRVTARDATRRYGSANPGFGARFDGFLLGQDASVLDGKLSFATDAKTGSNTGRYRITASGLASRNYAISYADGTLTVDPAQLTVTANDATRRYGGANPGFSARYDGFVLGQDARDLDGTLSFSTRAGRGSPVGRYGVTLGGLSSRNYAIRYVDGALTVAPGADSPTPAAAADVSALIDPFERGVPPYTPGDASFRTTKAEAPPAIDSPFALTYSLGRIVQLAPQGGTAPAATQGFVAAAGGLAEQRTDSQDPTCSGAINHGGATVCAREDVPESYWSSRE